MKKMLLYCLFLFATHIAAAQGNFIMNNRTMHANNRPVSVTFGGIADITTSNPKERTLDDMRLWLGGLDASREIMAAVNTYRAYDNDFFPGPYFDKSKDSLKWYKSVFDFNKIWSVSSYEIAAFKADLQDGKLDFYFPTIMAWAGRNNPHSKEFNGFELPKDMDLAPFKDVHNDGIYDPLQGDYPLLEPVAEERLPAHMTWCIYNDNTIYHTTKGKRMKVEVAQSTWAYDCPKDTVLNNTAFVSYKITNRGVNKIDSLFAGIFTTFYHNCFGNNIGCIPDKNTYWGNDRDENYPNCTPHKTLKPSVSITLLNKKMSSFASFMSYNNNGVTDPPPATISPNTNESYYYYLNGLWRDKSPIRCCYTGYYYPMDSSAITKFIFPGNPRDTNSWSLLNPHLNIYRYPRDGLSATYLKSLLPNQSERLDIAVSYHQDLSSQSILQNVGILYKNIPVLQNAYNQVINLKNCRDIDTCVGKDCIYPGDFNHDGIADLYDQLDYYRLDTTLINLPRNGTRFWIPQTGKDWQKTQHNGLNYKYADANADGKINYQDFKVISENYDYQTPYYIEPQDNYQNGKYIFMKKQTTAIDTSKIDINGNVSFRVSMRNEKDTSIKAFAFQIEFNKRFINSLKFSKLSFLKREIGNTIELDILSKNNISETMFIAFNTDYALKNKLPTPCTSIRIKNIKAVRKDGTLNSDLGSKDYVICFDKQFVTTKENIENLHISIFPNPFENQLIIENNNTQHIDYQILNMQGKLLKKGNILAENRQTIDTDFLPKGIYFIELKGGNGARKVEKLVK